MTAPLAAPATTAPIAPGPAIEARGLSKRFGADPRPRRARPRRPAGVGVRPARPERRRQDHDDPDPHRARPTDRGQRVGGRRGGRPRRAAAPSAGRLPRPGSAVLQLDEGPRAARARRPAPRTGRARSSVRASARCWRGSGLVAAGRAPDRRLLGRHAPAAGDRPGPPPPARDPVPRRAGQLARPGGPARPARADRRAARRGDRRLLDPRPVRRRADLRPGRDPRPRPARDRGAARGRCWPPTPGRSTGSCRRPGRTRRSPRWSNGFAPRRWTTDVDGRRRAHPGHGLRRTTPRRPACCRWSWRPASSSSRSSAPGRPSRTSSSSSSVRRRPTDLDGRGFVRPREVGRPMTGFGALLRKELLEQWRTTRLPARGDRLPARRAVVAAARPVHAGDPQGGRRRPVPDHRCRRRPPPMPTTSWPRTSASSGR